VIITFGKTKKCVSSLTGLDSFQSSNILRYASLINRNSILIEFALVYIQYVRPSWLQLSLYFERIARLYGIRTKACQRQFHFGRNFLNISQHGRGGVSCGRNLYSTDASGCVYAQEALRRKSLSRTCQLEVPLGRRWILLAIRP